MHDKAKAISAELLELDLKVQLYIPFINDKFWHNNENSKIKKKIKGTKKYLKSNEK